VSIAVIVMTDGRRDCIARAIPSLEEQITGDIAAGVIHDDSADGDYHTWLRARFPAWHLWATRTRAGFAGAYRHAWRLLCDLAESHVFCVEDDFTYNRPVNLDDLAHVLDANRHLAQLALRRQPWNDAERAAGGIVEQHPGDYCERSDGQHVWLEHRRFWTTNPSLFRASLPWLYDWPQGPESEGRFTHQLLDDPELRFGFWGARDSGEWIHHIGRDRVGVGY
jgi:hypothetical protein